jgi:hypothetical protein
MTRTVIRHLFVLILAIAATVVAAAHHGWSDYNEKMPLTVDGTITAFAYVNPHGTLKLKADKDGKVWDVVLAPVARMQTRGLTKAMLNVGTRATVLGYQHKTVATEMRAENITIDKKKVELR